MSTLARDPLKPIMMVVALGYLMILGAALIWLHLSPLIIFAMTIGGIALALCTIRPILAIHGLITLLNCQAILASSPAGDFAAKGMGGIIVLSWLLNIAVNRKRKLKIEGLIGIMSLFLLWCTYLITVSIDPGAAMSRTVTFVQLVVSAIIFSTVVDTPARLKGVYRTFVAWTTLSALVGIAQYLSGRPEAVGLIGNRNVFATYVIIGLVCIYALHQTTRNPIEKIVLTISAPVLILALALTFSRAGMIVLGLTMLFVLVRATRERRYTTLVAGTTLIILIAMFLPEAFWNRAETIIPSIQRQEDTFGTRVRLWEAGMRMVADHPVHGVGPGNFTVALPRYTKGVMMTARLGAHNSYVSVVAETGIVGLALFLLIHFFALRRIHRASVEAARSGENEVVMFALAAQACIMVVALSGLSGHLEYNKYLWIFFGLAIAIGRIRGPSTEAREPVHLTRHDQTYRPPMAANVPQFPTVRND